ncbi:hypothetical protein [Streptomyces syringium]|uniref:hypothetical protein n=1 Tax=Streptomyces syringium TaxID=76729 RepID=UPI0037CFCC88
MDSHRELAQEVTEKPDLNDLDSTHGRFAPAVTPPGVSTIPQENGWFFLAEDRTSWARIHGTAADRFGDRDLLRAVGNALDWRREQGRPPLGGLCITVTPEEQTTWYGVPEAATARCRS